MAPRALVFDLDGTLWDSYPWLARILGRGDFTATEAALASLLNGASAATLLRRAGVSESRFRRICSEVNDLGTYPGVTSTLRVLGRREVPLGVVTNLPAWIAAPMLERLELDAFFSSVVDWGRTTKRKPNPEPILAALGDLRVRPGPDAWYVGDSLADGEAAGRAGVSFAWASYGYGSIEPSNSAALIATFSDLLAL